MRMERGRGYDTCFFEAGVVWLTILNSLNRNIEWVELKEHEEALIDGDEVDDEDRGKG